MRYFAAEVVRDSAVSNTGIPSSLFRRKDTSVHSSASMSFLAQEDHPNSASIVEQVKSDDAEKMVDVVVILDSTE